MCAIEAFYCALWLSLAMVLSLSFHFKKLEMSFQFTNCDMRMHNWHSKVSSPASHLLFHMYVFTTIFNFSNLATSSPCHLASVTDHLIGVNMKKTKDLKWYSFFLIVMLYILLFSLEFCFNWLQMLCKFQSVRQ